MRSREDYHVTVRETLAWLIGRRKRFSVTGESMAPLLQPGDDVLVDPRATAVVGDVVVAEHPHTAAPIVKLVTAIDDSGVTLEGLSRSTDSRHFGPVDPTAVVGVVTAFF